MINKKRFELLAPGGDLDSIKAAIAAGADAIYCGLNRFNARNRAENINVEELSGIVKCAHDNDCKIFVTLNILILDNEIRPFINLLNRLIDIEIDGVIVQDLGALYLLKYYFKNLKVHVSTQFTTHNKGQIKFLKKLNAERVNLCRELSFKEIKLLTQLAHTESMAVEVFVHGSNCISFSGQCYMSSVHSGKSGNRGRCSQPCRDKYKLTRKQKNYPLNLKDNCAFLDIKLLSEIGVDSLKIEGRIKKFHYVYTVVSEWKKQLDRYYKNYTISNDYGNLYKIFNRGYTNSFLTGKINNDIFIDNPRDDSANRLKNNSKMNIDLKSAKKEIYDNRTQIIEKARAKIDQMSFVKIPLNSEKKSCTNIELPIKKFERKSNYNVNTELNILISSEKDIELYTDENVNLYFLLTNNLSARLEKTINVFKQNKKLIPYFPAILIDEDYEAALKILKMVSPSLIVTDNMGIGYEAFQKNIEWIAGPYSNITNTYSTFCLKEEFNCVGAFVSNELSLKQLRKFACPPDFKLYYSIYHPIQLMISRACLFTQIDDCAKKNMDEKCIKDCEKRSTITNLKNDSFIVDKKNGEYCKIYNDKNYLNLDIVKDMNELFTGYLVDLREICTITNVNIPKTKLIDLFKKYLSGNDFNYQIIRNEISNTTCSQYINGI